MAQQLIIDFVRELTQQIELPEPIVEFGSLLVEPDQPGDLRTLFPRRQFIGTDMRAGPGVDRVEDLRGLSFAEAEVGSAICLDTLEHCEDPRQACHEMHRVLRPGGVCVISSVMLFPIHAYPNDYWRFTPEGFRLLLAPFDDVWVTTVGPAELPMQVIGVAARGRSLGLSEKPFMSLQAAQRAWDPQDMISLGVIPYSLGNLVREVSGQLPRVLARRAVARLRRVR